jgi:hypothetical protein
MTGGPRAGREAAHQALFDQDRSAEDGAGGAGRRLSRRGTAAAVDPAAPHEPVALPTRLTPALPSPTGYAGPPSPTPSVAPMGGGTYATAPMDPAAAGPTTAASTPALRRPLVRPVPGRGRSSSRRRKTEKRPSFRGFRRLADHIGFWRRLRSLVELVIVVAVLGALVAAVIGAIVGAVVVALQKALNG